MTLTLMLACLVGGTAASSVAVMPMTSTTVDAAKVKVLDRLVVSATAALTPHRVISSDEINSMLGLERMRDALGCNDVSCAAEIGGALGVEFLLLSSADTLGDYLVLTTSLLDVQKAVAVSRQSARVSNNENAWFDGVQSVVAATFGAASKPTSAIAGATNEKADVSSGSLEQRPYHVAVVSYMRQASWTPAPQYACTGDGCTEERTKIGWGIGGEYRWQHHDLISVAGRAGVNFFGRPSNSGFDQIDPGLYLAVVETVTIPLVRANSLWPTEANIPFAFTLGAGGDMHVGDSVIPRIVGEAGVRFWWLQAQVTFGYQFVPDVIEDSGSEQTIWTADSLSWGTTVGFTFAL